MEANSQTRCDPSHIARSIICTVWGLTRFLKRDGAEGIEVADQDRVPRQAHKPFFFKPFEGAVDYFAGSTDHVSKFLL